MLLTLLPGATFARPGAEGVGPEVVELLPEAVPMNGTAEPPAQGFSDYELSILTSTLATPVGIFGFEEDFADDPSGFVEIGVQFRTPPAVALRLLAEDGHPYARSLSVARMRHRR